MRISDWSSDVCSSDLITVRGAEPRKPKGASIDDTLFAQLPDPPFAPGHCNIMVAGIGGTGAITVAPLIGMAENIEGIAASVFDMTGHAKKHGDRTRGV